MFGEITVRTPFHLLLGSFLVIASCDGAETPRALDWDLSSDTQLTRVGWPKDRSPEVWYVDGPGTINIKARGGLQYEVAYWFAQVWRVGGQVRTVCIMLPPGDVEQTHAAATKLANDLGFPDRRGLDDFLKTRGERILRGGAGPSVGSIHADNIQPRMIEIRQSFAGPGKEWHAILILGFPEKRDTPPSATQATTRP
jgi:hypothetical protein